MNLTPEQLKQNAAAMLAWADGKPVEWRYVGDADQNPWRDLVDKYPRWDCRNFEFRPAPDPIAPGHNPDRLTVSQVGEGWRLLDKKEGYGTKHSPAWWQSTEYNSASMGWRTCGNHHLDSWSNDSSTLRTRLTHEELMALDKPSVPKAEPWAFEDAPMVFRVKDKADGSLYRAEIYPEHVGIFHSYAPQAFRAISYQYLLDNFVQLDGSPCGIVK